MSCILETTNKLVRSLLSKDERERRKGKSTTRRSFRSFVFVLSLPTSSLLLVCFCWALAGLVYTLLGKRVGSHASCRRIRSRKGEGLLTTLPPLSLSNLPSPLPPPPLPFPSSHQPPPPPPTLVLPLSPSVQGLLVPTSPSSNNRTLEE